MGAAALPGRTGQGRADGLHEAAVRVGGDQPDPGQAAGGQVAEERQPARAVLGRGDLQPEDFPVPTSVDPSRHQRMHVDHSATLANLKHERVGGYEGVRPLVQRAAPEVRDCRVEFARHHADLCPR